MPAPAAIAFTLSLTTLTLVLGFTTSSSPLRLGGLPLMLASVYLATSASSAQYFHHPLYANILGGSATTLLSLYIDAVLLSAWTYAARGPTSSLGGQVPKSADTAAFASAHSQERPIGAAGRRVAFALSRAFDCRLVATSWEVASVPPFPSGRAPPRGRFIAECTVRAGVCFMLLDGTRLLAGPPEQNTLLFSAEKVPVLRRLRAGTLPAEDVVLRCVSVLMFGTITYLLFEAVHRATAAVTVGLRVSPVERWRPLFGNLGDAWSVRRFWGYVIVGLEPPAPNYSPHVVDLHILTESAESFGTNLSARR